MSLRLFIAIEMPDDVKNRLVRLRADIPGATWVKPHAYHLTLRFLGDGIAEDRVPPLKDALAAIKTAPFELTISGVGKFPPGSKPARVLWVGMDAPPALNQLAKGVESAVRAVGFPPEDKPFSAHITLARLKFPKKSPEVDTFLTAHQAFQSSTIAVAEFHLISSVLTPQGPNYTHLATFALNTV